MECVAHQARFAAWMTAITRRLPFGLSEVVAPSLVGYLLINLCTFFIDLGILGLLHGHFHWPIPAAVTVSYGTASLISYIANRILNFRSHENVGRQFPLYVAVSASNYLIAVLTDENASEQEGIDTIEAVARVVHRDLNQGRLIPRARLAASVASPAPTAWAVVPALPTPAPAPAP